MSSPITSIRIDLGPATEEFSRFLQQEIAQGRIPAGIQAEFRAGEKFSKGFALAIPPEIVFAVATGAAAEIGKLAVSALWSAFKHFFEKSPPASASASIVVVINEVRTYIPVRDILNDHVPQPFRLIDR